MSEKKSLSTILWVILALIAIGFAAHLLYPVKKELKEKQAELQKQKSKLHELKKEQSRKEAENHALKKSPGRSSIWSDRENPSSITPKIPGKNGTNGAKANNNWKNDINPSSVVNNALPDLKQI